MNPNRGEGVTGSELQPAVMPEFTKETNDEKPERSPSRPEATPSKQPKVPQPVVQMPTDYSPAVIPSDDDQSQQTAQDTMAKDDRLIERRWVDSAKNIINQTKDDPYKQKNEMSKFKADYIKQRFNKVVKADPEAL